MTNPGGTQTARPVTITIHGIPAPQGSKRAYISARGRAAIVESGGTRQKSWRQAVVDAALTAGTPMLAGPVEVAVTFYLGRPKGHYGTGRNARTVRASAPEHPARMPDIDKLLRNTLDGLTAAGIYADDGQVVNLAAAKQWAPQGQPPGAVISVTPLEDEAGNRAA